ncbi:hypothetical protein [Caballeronia sp.]|uniref:hypothetical protein n=1 Tax=Caballeronia sp. TaxID=1931223 RepID=UPI003C54521A
MSGSSARPMLHALSSLNGQPGGVAHPARRNYRTRSDPHQEPRLHPEFEILKTTPGIGNVLPATIMLETVLSQ